MGTRVNAVGEPENTVLIVAKTAEEAKRKGLELENIHSSMDSAIAACAAGYGYIWTVTLRVEFIDAHMSGVGSRAHAGNPGRKGAGS